MTRALDFDDDQALLDLAARVGESLTQRGWILVTAESCTGGWVGQAVTAVAGSSIWYDRGFIMYSNRSKCEMLGVQPALLDQFGAVSPQTAQAMVAGALTRSHAQIGLSITGIADPMAEQPKNRWAWCVFAWASKEGLVQQETRHFKGNRESIRHSAVTTALQGVLHLLDNTIVMA